MIEWQPDETLVWRGRDWFVADVQDDIQHVHLTLVERSVDPNPPQTK